MEIEEKIRQKVNLKDLTTLRIGGEAAFLAEINTREELIEALAWCRRQNQPFFVLGGGSNLLVSDAGFAGMVLLISDRETAIQGERLACAAGANLIATARQVAAKGLEGLEWAVGIPGTIGGAIRGNAGAFGQAMSDVVETAEIYSLRNQRFYRISNKDCEFAYRESIFKKNDDLVIWSAVLKLRKSSPEKLIEKMENYVKVRTESQPKLPSAGCFFKNIPVSELDLANPELLAEASRENAIRDGYLSAGWLIDRLDLKGKSIGGAKISLEHANFIVNTGKATAAEVVMLVSVIKQQLRTKFNIQLREEVKYIGF